MVVAARAAVKCSDITTTMGGRGYYVWGACYDGNRGTPEGRPFFIKFIKVHVKVVSEHMHVEFYSQFELTVELYHVTRCVITRCGSRHRSTTVAPSPPEESCVCVPPCL